MATSVLKSTISTWSSRRTIRRSRSPTPGSSRSRPTTITRPRSSGPQSAPNGPSSPIPLGPLPPETWFVIRRRSPIVRYAESSPREVRKQGPDSAARFPYCGNLLRRRCPGRGSMVPLRQVSTLTCVSPRTAGDGHPRSTSPPFRRSHRGAARPPGLAKLRAAVASTVTLRRFRS